MVEASDVGRLVRIPDGRTGRLALVRGRTCTVRMPSGEQLLFFPSELQPVKR